MKNVWTITSRELQSYFVSPIAYVISALFLVAMGYLFSLILINSQDASMQSTFSNMMFLLLLLAPALTMKLLADEQRMGTIELLLTSPVNDWQVVLGKFLGSLILFAVMLVGPTLYYVLILKVFGSPDYGPILTGYLGLLLLGGSFLAVGVFTSALTQNQVIAYFAGLVILILLWIADAAGGVAGTGSIGNMVSYLAITQHYNNFFRGVIDTTDVVYALSVIAVALFLATQVLQTRRWR
ncbi:MAG: ABC transporter permease [Chloroflexi bacterium]|nr:ABC transporter permease [Chloroflexota bacterium]MCL5951427.1 ABC transporter permease [Chloroflexota bacterium]